MQSTLLNCLKEQSTHNKKNALIFLPKGDISNAKCLTYQQCLQKSLTLAAALKHQGLVGKRVLIAQPSSNEYVISLLACLAAGAIAVPAYPPRNRHHAKRLSNIIESANISAILTTDFFLSRIKGYYSQQVITADIAKNVTDTFINQAISDNDIAYLQYTSGSTSTPKGVMVSHADIINNCQLIIRDTKVSQGLINVSWLPLFHDLGIIQGLFLPLYLGGTAIFMPPEYFIQRPIRWLNAIANYKADMAAAPNFAYDLCINIEGTVCADLNLDSWRYAVNGGEPVQANTLDKFTALFARFGLPKTACYPSYGMAEASLYITGGDPAKTPIKINLDSQALKQGLVKEVAPNKNNTITLVSCGTVKDDPIVTIVDPESLSPSPENSIGEIWLAGSSITQGYWNNNKASSTTFKQKLAKHPNKEFMRTNDLGFIHNGQLYITGRLNDLIIIRGENHYPQDIERTTEATHESLRKGNFNAAFSINNKETGQTELIIVQEVARNQRHHIITESVKKLIKRAIVNQHGIQPSDIELLMPGQIPKTSSGKVQRHVCKKSYLTKKFKIISPNH